MFDNDTQINNFLTLQEEFSGLNIDTDSASQSQILKTENQSQIHGKHNNLAISPKTANQMLHPTIFNQHNIQEIQQVKYVDIADYETEVIQLKDNFLPVCLAPLEDIFDSNDVPNKPKLQPLNTTIEEHNIGTVEKPKIIKLSAALPPDQKPK